jgi:hypothetical protein
MCGFGSNQSAPSSQFSTQTTTASPQAQAMYGQAWSNAQNVANRPFTPYSNDPNAFVAPMNSTQLSAVNNLYGMQNAGQGYYEQAPAMAYASGNTNAAGLVPQYMSPYLNSVAAATMGILGQQQGQEQNKLSGQIAQNGQWGNSRSGVERALLSGQQNLATANTISNLYNTGYNSALGAAQTDLKRQLDASGSLAGQGQTGATNLLGAGTVGQQTQQKGLEALYNQFVMQQQYPFQVAQFLSSTAAGLGPGYGGTTSGYQQSQQPLSFMGNPLSDPALKVGAEGKKPEVIGETNDGQDIYRYRVVNPDTGELGPVQIGLMADEVQQRRPDAIGDYKGFKTVDYAKATDGAARMGGGVTERGDYADGGGIADLLRAHEAMYGGMGEKPAGLVPQSQMPTAKLDLPPIHFAEVPHGSGGGLGELAKGAVGLIDDGKSLYKQGSGLYDWLTTPSTDKTMSADNYASGGGVGVYNAHPDESEGPEVTQMPVAKLNAPELSFGSSGNQAQSGGLGGLINGATGLAGAAKTLWDVGKFVAPLLGLKSGGRVGYADGGGLSDEDNDYVARTLMKEAGGEGQRGMEAVANVIRNRLTSGRYGDTAKDVVVAPKQFSPWNEEARGTNADPRLADPSSPLYQTAAQISRRVLGGEGEDITGGATHFYNPKLANPKWAAGKEGLDIGNHRFLSADAGAGIAPGRALALAGPEERPSHPGLDAMPPRSGGLAPSESAAAQDQSPAQGISGMIRGAPASGLGERALDFATSERFLVPLLTGLGAMASSGSRYLAPAVLQGLGAGAQAYMGTQKTQSEIMKNTLGLAATRFKPLESGNFYDNVAGRVVSPQERLSAMQGMFNGTIGSGGGGLAPSTASEPPAASPVAGEVATATDTARKIGAPVPLTGSDMESAAVLEKAMKQPAVAHYLDEASMFERKAANLQAMGQSDEATHFTTWANNSRTAALSLAKELARPDLDALAEKNKLAVSTKSELVETQDANGTTHWIPKADVLKAGENGAPVAKQPLVIAERQKALGDYARHVADSGFARDQARANLVALADVLKQYESGRFAEQKSALVGALKSAGFDIDPGAAWESKDFEKFVKNSMGTVLAQAAGSGDERLKSAFESVLKANANAGLQPEANRSIIGKALGLLDWEDKHADEFTKWYGNNQLASDRTAFENEWRKNNPTKGFIENATNKVPVLGEKPPPINQRRDGYQIVQNGAVWEWKKSANKWAKVM